MTEPYWAVPMSQALPSPAHVLVKNQRFPGWFRKLCDARSTFINMNTAKQAIMRGDPRGPATKLCVKCREMMEIEGWDK